MWTSALPSEHLYLLPGGLAIDGERRLAEAELRPLAGREEAWLAQHPDAPSAVIATRLLSSCLVRLDDVPGGRDLVRRLLVGDRDYLLLQLRRLTLGKTIRAVLVCPACGAKIDVDFRVDDVPVERRPQTALIYSLDLSHGEPARTVRFRLPTGADQEAVIHLSIEAAVAALLARCLVDDGGTPLSPDVQTMVIDAMEQLAPQLELELDLVCPECDHAFCAPFDTTAFFFQEMRTSGHALLREVHHLAFHYHWSEAAILRLTRDRRRAYLALLSDALRRD